MSSVSSSLSFCLPCLEHLSLLVVELAVFSGVLGQHDLLQCKTLEGKARTYMGTHVKMFGL